MICVRASTTSLRTTNPLYPLQPRDHVIFPAWDVDVDADTTTGERLEEFNFDFGAAHVSIVAASGIMDTTLDTTFKSCLSSAS